MSRSGFPRPPSQNIIISLFVFASACLALFSSYLQREVNLCLMMGKRFSFFFPSTAQFVRTAFGGLSLMTTLSVATLEISSLEWKWTWNQAGGWENADEGECKSWRICYNSVPFWNSNLMPYTNLPNCLCSFRMLFSSRHEIQLKLRLTSSADERRTIRYKLAAFP